MADDRSYHYSWHIQNFRALKRSRLAVEHTVTSYVNYCQVRSPNSSLYAMHLMFLILLKQQLKLSHLKWTA